MNWLIVVVFATMAGDVYIFTDPKFDTKEACMTSIKDPQAQVGYIEKLVEEYQRQMPIHMVNCLQEDVINEILEKYPGAPVKEGQAT
jgi:hypothetical protein